MGVRRPRSRLQHLRCGKGSRRLGLSWLRVSPPETGAGPIHRVPPGRGQVNLQLSTGFTVAIFISSLWDEPHPRPSSSVRDASPALGCFLERGVRSVRILYVESRKRRKRVSIAHVFGA